MSNKQSMDLIQAKALGCLDPEDDVLLDKLMKEDKNFPWEELGQYQNLVAFLPILLDIEAPDPEVKDNVARELYELGEKLKAEKVEEVEQNTIPEEAESDNIEEDGFTIDEEQVEDAEIPKDEEDLSTLGSTADGISFKAHGVPLKKLLYDDKNVKPKPKMKKQPEVPEAKPTPRQPKKELEQISEKVPELKKTPRQAKEELEEIFDEVPETKTIPTQPKKGLEQKSDEFYLSNLPAGAADSESSKSSKSKGGTIVAVILFIVALLALFVVYSTLSSDIEENRKKIDKLEKQIGTGIILENTLKHNSFNT
jgi:hypothetical protein